MTRRLTISARIALLFDGRPPYTLAVGANHADNVYLPIDQLIPGYRLGAEDQLPLATIAPSPARRLTLAAEDDAFSTRAAALWGLLLAGVALLAWMVWRLWRPRKEEDDDD